MTARSASRRRAQIRAHVRVASSVLVVIATLAACGGSSPSATSDTTPNDTTPDDPATTVAAPTTAPDEPSTEQWDALLDGIGDDGEVSKQLAIDTFSLGVAPLPGATVQRSDADAMVADATAAVSWIARYFDELSPEQQVAVGEALSAPDAAQSGTTSGFRRTESAATPGPTIGCYGQVVPGGDSPGAEPYRAVVDEMVDEITSRLGGAIEMVVPIYLVVDDRDLGIALAYTWADPGDCDQNGLATCTISLSPAVGSEDPLEQRGIIAHEVFHCFQFQYLGLAAHDLQPWVLEGLPAWVGEDIAGGTKVSTKWWTRYLTAPTRSLYGRDYDAIGFYAHLDEVGIDPWSQVIAIFDGFSNEPAFEAAGASSGSFLESWPSSHLRRTDIGRAWDAVGPGITIDRATPAPLSVANGGVATGQTGKVSGQLFQVAIAADIVTFEFSGWARLGAEDGTDEVLASGTTYCAKPGGCVCPDGSSAPFDPIATDVVVGLTGGTMPASLTISGQRLDCETEEEPLVDPCLVGRWVSTQLYIDDTVTGAPVNELGGGDGVVLDIAKDGSFTMDFNESSPTSTDLGDGLVISSTTRGVAHGRITAEGGKVELLEQDYSTALTTEMNTGGTLPGGIGISTGSYSCSGGRMEMRAPFELGESIGAFNAV